MTKLIKLYKSDISYNGIAYNVCLASQKCHSQATRQNVIVFRNYWQIKLFSSFLNWFIRQ